LSWTAVSSWALLAWFVALAIAELRFHQRELRSSARDARLVTNFTLAAVTVGASGILPLAKVGSSLLAQKLGLGVHPDSTWIAVFTLTLTAQTFVAYWLHRTMHRAPLLWRVHRVHHSDTSVDVSTSLRHHPLELLVTTPAAALVILLIGAPVSVVLASETFLVTTAFFGHAEIVLPCALDRALAWIVVTPRLHRLHHHPERRLHDSNYGDTLTVWDRVFGTFSDESERMPVGLEKPAGRPDHLLDQILSPLQAA
jgi:sterol desaturase/sphingolipid hydroxylase (fatty acid hydroxylase superfamily)